MTKSLIAKLFIGGIVLAVIGYVLEIVAFLSALAGGVITIGGAYLVQFNGWAISPWMIAMVVVGGVAIGAGTIVALVAWVGALLNTYQLEDKTWFAVLLVLGLLSFGFLAMVAYLIAGPDGTKPAPITPALPSEATA